MNAASWETTLVVMMVEANGGMDAREAALSGLDVVYDVWWAVERVQIWIDDGLVGDWISGPGSLAPKCPLTDQAPLLASIKCGGTC